MIKSQSTSRLFITALIMLVVLTAAVAGDGEGDKDGKKGTKKDGVAAADTTKADTYGDIDDHIIVDDTLVFEDWDTPDGGGEDDGQAKGVFQGGNEVGGTKAGVADQFFSGVAKAAETFKKEYRVEFTIYPNPTANELHIKSGQIPQSIQVTNLVGKVCSQGDYTPTLNVSELQTGTYFLQLIYPDRHVESRKFIKY